MKQLKFITKPEKINGTPLGSFKIKTYDKPMPSDSKRRYIVMKVELTPVYFQKYKYVMHLRVTYKEPCRHSYVMLNKRPGSKEKRGSGYILQDKFKRDSSEGQYFILHIPDGLKKVGFDFKIDVFSKPKKPGVTMSHVDIRFLVKQEPAEVNGKKIIVHMAKTPDCKVVAVPYLAPTDSSYRLGLKSYLGKNMKLHTSRLLSVYWYLNKKSDKIIDIVKKKSKDGRFPDLEASMGLNTEVDRVLSYIKFPDVQPLIGKTVGITYRLILKSYPSVTTELDVSITVQSLSGLMADIEKGKKKLVEGIGNIGDKVSVVATRMKNIQTLSREEVNDSMMVIGGGLGFVFVILIIIIICCCKSKAKQKEKDEEIPGDEKEGEEQPTDDKEQGDKPMTETQSKREKYSKEKALREEARSANRYGTGRSSYGERSRREPSRYIDGERSRREPSRYMDGERSRREQSRYMDGDRSRGEWSRYMDGERSRREQSRYMDGEPSPFMDSYSRDRLPRRIDYSDSEDDRKEKKKSKKKKKKKKKSKKKKKDKKKKKKKDKESDSSDDGESGDDESGDGGNDGGNNNEKKDDDDKIKDGGGDDKGENKE